MTLSRTIRGFALVMVAGSVSDAVAGTPNYRPAASRPAIERDWILQDYMSIRLPDPLDREKQQWRETHLKAEESRTDPPVLEHPRCFDSDVDAVVEQRMIERTFTELDAAAAPLRAELGQLVRAGVTGGDPRWKTLYLRACELRRETRLRPLLDRWTRLVLSQHRHNPGSWKYTEGPSQSPNSRAGFLPGSAIEEVTLDGPYARVRTLIEDPTGFLRNPEVSFDGRRLLFAWKKSMDNDDLHLYEMQLVDGTVRQLTHGLGNSDYEGVYLPDGNILFNSTRCFQTTPCNSNVVSNFYVMDGNGRFMRRVGFDQVHTIFPTVTDDGRVLYTRWEYVDRGQIYPQPLFQMNPDGTNQREFYGNNSWFPTNILHARKLPGSRKIVAIITGHHRPATGKLALIDPARGRQEGRGVQLIAPIRTTKPIRKDAYGEGGNQFQYPYPVDERHFLVTLSIPTPRGKVGRFNVYLVDVDGGRELLVEGREDGAGVGCKQILPMAPRPRPHVRPDLADHRQPTGIVYLHDIHAGAALRGVPRGTIKRLRIVAVRYQVASFGALSHRGQGGSSRVLTPVAVGHGSWDVKEVVGTATVHKDGSAAFEVPARTPIYFQALDERGYVVQTMRSWTTLMPGETQSCVGCHEHKNSVPPVRHGPSLAMRAGVQQLKAFYGPPRGFSFPKEVQPILDRQCTRCHNDSEENACNLSPRLVTIGGAQRRFSQAYLSLTHTRGDTGDCNHRLVNWIDSMSEPSPLPPYYRGAATSGLMKLLADGHEDVRLSREEHEKIACWIDLLVPYCGDFTESHTWPEKDVATYARYAERRQKMEEIDRQNIMSLMEHREAETKQ